MIRGADLADLRRDWQTQIRRELLAEIDAALRSDAAAMHHSSSWRNQGYGSPLGDADYLSSEFMADFVAQRFKP
jgi:hypothetical protein